MLFFSEKIDGRTSVFALPFNSCPCSRCPMDPRLNSRGCWAHGSGKSESVWGLEIWHAMLLSSQRPDELCRKEVVAVIRAESYGPPSGVPAGTCSWFSVKESHCQRNETLRDLIAADTVEIHFFGSMMVTLVSLSASGHLENIIFISLSKE